MRYARMYPYAVQNPSGLALKLSKLQGLILRRFMCIFSHAINSLPSVNTGTQNSQHEANRYGLCRTGVTPVAFRVLLSLQLSCILQKHWRFINCNIFSHIIAYVISGEVNIREQSHRHRLRHTHTHKWKML